MNAPIRQTIDSLLAEHGRTFADELGIDLAADSPKPFFRLLCFTLLCSTRIGTRIAVAAARAVTEAGWTDPSSMTRSTWEQRVQVLDDAGYARYDFRTAVRLEQLADRVLERYGGDVRRLRVVADHDPSRERRLLQEFVGIGPVGTDIFLREAQAVWPELRPYADERTLATAAALGLPADARHLAALVPQRDYPRLVAALVRVRVAHERARAGAVAP